MRSGAIIAAGFALLVLQSTFAQMMPWDMFVPSLSLPVVMYMGLHDYNPGKGALLSFALGYLMDVFAGSPMGLYTFVAVAVFLISRVAALRLFLQGWVFEIILVFVLALVSAFLILAVRALFDKDFGSLLIHLKIVTSRAVATAVVAPLIFRMMMWIDAKTPRSRTGEGRIMRG